MSLFTPVSGGLGGSLIGLSAGILLLGNGDILGCSGIVSSVFVKPRETFKKAKWKAVFVSAFLITSRLISKFGQSRETLELEQQIIVNSSSLPHVSTIGYCVAGFLVGFGTRLGNGCTSGHGICGLARLSKRSLVAVATFMSTGILAATACSPLCVVAKYLRTKDESFLDKHYPTEKSALYSAALITIISSITFTLSMASCRRSKNETNTDDAIDEGKKKNIVAALAAAVFSAGLFISGMTKNFKIYGFLDLKLFKNGSWDPTLIFVMGGGLIVSAISYHFVKGHNIFKNEKVLSCPLVDTKGKFNVPTSTKIDKQLIVGSALFGIGWGLAGLCPGPALFLAANGYPKILYFWWPCNIVGVLLGEKAKRWI